MSTEPHLDEVLSRYLARDLPQPEAEAARRHIAECPDCRRQLDRLRQLDQLLSQPLELPRDGAFSWLLDRAGEHRRRLRRASYWLIALFLVQVGAGVWLLVTYADREPLLAGLAGGLLIADSALLPALAFLHLSRSHELGHAMRDWRTLRAQWTLDLQRRVRSARLGVASSALLIALGLLFSIRAALPPLDALLLVPGLFMLATGILGTVLHPLQARRATAQLTTLEQLEHAA